MAYPPFTESLLKLRRANKHIGELQEVRDNYVSSMPIYRVFAPSRQYEGRYEYELIISKLPPTEMAAIIGDVFHNLRAALDLLANELVRISGGNTKDVYFPFAKSATALESQIKNKKFDRARPQDVDLLRSIKPYSGGNDALRAIHDIDIQDKHQMLMPFIGQLSHEGGGVGLYGSDMTVGTIIRGMDITPTFDPRCPLHEQKFPVQFDLYFPMMHIFDSQQIIPKLRELLSVTFDVIDTFAKSHGTHVSL